MRSEDINKVQWLPIEQVITSVKNPRKITQKELDRLQTSIANDEDFLTKRPVLVALMSRRYMVYAGAQRLAAMKALGYTEVPVFVAKGIDQETFDRRMVLDNVHFGEWDFKNVTAEFEGQQSTLQQIMQADGEDDKTLHFVTEKKSRTNAPKIYRYEISLESESQYVTLLNVLIALGKADPNASIAQRILKKVSQKLGS